VSSRIDHRRAATVRDGFFLFPVFTRLTVRGGPTEGGTLVGLEGDGMDAFNHDNQAAILTLSLRLSLSLTLTLTPGGDPNPNPNPKPNTRRRS